MKSRHQLTAETRASPVAKTAVTSCEPPCPVPTTSRAAVNSSGLEACVISVAVKKRRSLCRRDEARIAVPWPAMARTRMAQVTTPSP